MSRGAEQTRYYVSLGWWMIKISIVIFVLIPGSLPVLFGFLISYLYRIVDPELIVYSVITEWYHSSIGMWHFGFKISSAFAIVLFLLCIYLVYLKRRHPGKSIVEISKTEVKQQVSRLTKPQNPKLKNHNNSITE